MRVYIWASSETERDPERKLRWGDYWLKLRLEQELERQGWAVDASLSDGTEVFIHCFGGNTISNLPAHTYNVLYIHSHPARLADFDFGMYDRVVAGSEKLAQRLGGRGIKATWNIGATDFVPMDVPLEHDAVFVGNNRGRRPDKPITRPIITALGDLATLPFKLEVWGEGWEMLPDGIWQGPFIHNDELNALYSSSAVVLNDTHADMVEAGIINSRVLDALSCRTAVFSDGDSPWYCQGWFPINEYLIENVANEVTAIADGAPRAEGPTADWSYARLVRDLVGGIAPRLRVDLGCGNHKREGYTGIDKTHAEGVDIVWDIRDGMPATDAVDYAVADNLMEHIGAEFIQSMNGVHDAMAETGRFTVTVPGVHDLAAAFADPTHVRWFVPETWDYFDADNARWQDYGKSYGIKPWRVLRRAVRDRFIDVVLQPVKECK